MKCTQCKSEMEKVQFDVGYGISVDSLHCEKCGFNITQDKKLKNALSTLREQMSKPVKLVRIGTGIGDLRRCAFQHEDHAEGRREHPARHA